MSMIDRTGNFLTPATKTLDCLSPIVDLAFRLWVANVFWKSGLTKIANWDTTVFLFTEEYQVPFLSPAVGAFLGTGAELVLPPLLALGLAIRFAAIALLVFNVVAVISYPALNPVGLKDHTYWSLMLLVPIFHGPGKLSIDQLLQLLLNKTHGGRATRAWTQQVEAMRDDLRPPRTN